MDRNYFDQLCAKKAGNKFHNHENETHQWWMQQHAEEFWTLLSKAGSARTVLELGVNHGGTLVFWDHLVGKGGLTLGIDLNKEGYLLSMFRSEYCDYRAVSELHTLSGDSHKPAALRWVNDKRKGLPIDVLFIDGDHSYEGAKQDYKMYSPLVATGGLVAIHDVMIEPRVKRLFDEIEGDKEIVHFGGPGIGIVRM